MPSNIISQTTNIPIPFLQEYTPIVTAIGVIVAAVSIYRNTDNARKRATLDMIVMERNDKELQVSIRKTNELSKTPGLVFNTYISEKEEDKEARQQILRVLNQREFVSGGVLNGALHEKMYKVFSYSMLLRDWCNLRGFIYELREMRNAPTAFQEFETLAKKWKKSPLKEKH